MNMNKKSEILLRFNKYVMVRYLHIRAHTPMKKCKLIKEIHLPENNRVLNP